MVTVHIYVVCILSSRQGLNRSSNTRQMHLLVVMVALVVICLICLLIICSKWLLHFSPGGPSG